MRGIVNYLLFGYLKTIKILDNFVESDFVKIKFGFWFFPYYSYTQILSEIYKIIIKLN